MSVTTESDVQFVPIAPSLRGRSAPASDQIVANACRKHKGQYAVLPLHGRSVKATQIGVNHTGTKAFPKGQFRVAIRGGVAYVAYVGR